jgi:serine/threonine protein kinase
LWDGLQLQVHFSSKIVLVNLLDIIPNRTAQVCMNDFQLLKVIGKGGFSKVFLVRKKDSGLLFAMKVMQKSFVMTDGKFK